MLLLHGDILRGVVCIELLAFLGGVDDRRQSFLSALFSHGDGSVNDGCQLPCYKTSILINNYQRFVSSMSAQPQTKKLLALVRKATQQSNLSETR
jgi:hypothetical protein